MRLRTFSVWALLAPLLFAGCGPSAAPSGDTRKVEVQPGLKPDNTLPSEELGPQLVQPLEDIRVRLQRLPGVIVREEADAPTGTRVFALDFAHLVDHANAEGPLFVRRARLIHVDESRPMVLWNSGYFLSTSQTRTELARVLNANQISVEYRYFKPSRPTVDPTFAHLTGEQAAADDHDVVQTLKAIYPHAWISSGASKGGLASIINKRFYPDDYVAAVAYVAPVMPELKDSRWGTYAKIAGPHADCRRALQDVQRGVLKNRSRIFQWIVEDAVKNKRSYKQLTVERAIEHAVLELPVYFWQYGDASYCPTVPRGEATPEDLFKFLEEWSSVEDLSDAEIEDYLPYYVQYARHEGSPKYPEDAIADLLKFPGTHVPSTYLSSSMKVNFDPTPTANLLEWVQTQGDRLLLVYGENDPWTDVRLDITGARDSFSFIEPDGNHGARLSRLKDADRRDAFDALERWTGVSVTPL